MMEVIKIKSLDLAEVPKNYTGIAKYPDGSRDWYLNGKLHREDGPACEWVSGTKVWYLNGMRHREDGPAMEYADGTKEWYFNGIYLFGLLSISQPFIIIEEFVDEEGNGQIKVLTQQGIETWPCVPGLKELADNWEKE